MMTKSALRGVNLGGWLVLEKWMTPTLFKDTTAEDEYSLMQATGGPARVEEHRRTFITEADFEWLADNKIDIIRIPVGYWLFDGDNPYTQTISYLDWAVDMAQKYNLQVLIDLHGAKGSQNGRDHSGKKGAAGWYSHTEYRRQTLDVLERLAERYYRRPCVWGIELLNEPKWGLLQLRLRRFYREAYKLLRVAARPGTHIVFSDAFTPWLMSGAIAGTPSHPVAMDIHWYHFAAINRRLLSFRAYFAKLRRRVGTIHRLQHRQAVVVGEWSVVLAGESLDGLAEDNKIELQRQHGQLQLEVYGSATAWFYWTYKTEGRGVWNFRSLIEDGLLTLD